VDRTVSWDNVPSPLGVVWAKNGFFTKQIWGSRGIRAGDNIEMRLRKYSYFPLFEGFVDFLVTKFSLW
jgi:hypothetical protein